MSITSETPAASIYDKQPHVVITNSHSEAIPDKSTPVEDLQLEWDGPDDVGCPRNWPLWKRIFHTAIPALHGLVITLAASSYVPAIPSIQVHFGVNQEVATLGVSLYLIGLALGPLPIAPLSEIIGRRYIYLVALPILVVFDIGAACAHNIQTLLILRFLGAFFGSGAIAVIAGTVVDVWDLNKGGALAAVFSTFTPFLGPVLGPVAGAYIIDEYDNWRFGLWVVAFLAAPIVILTLFLSETFKPIILTKRAKKRQYTVPPRPKAFDFARRVVRIAFTRPIYMIVFDPLVTFYTLYLSFTLLVMFSFFGSYSMIFQGVFHLSDRHTSLAFVGMLIGLLLGVALFAILDLKCYKKPGLAAGVYPAPEARLYPLLVSSVLLPISLFWLAWTSSTKYHWSIPMASGLVFGCAASCIYFTTLVYLVMIYKSEAGASVLAALGLMRYTFAAASPLFIVQMYTALGPRWAGSVLAFVSLGLMPVPWLFWWYGAMLRQKKAKVAS